MTNCKCGHPKREHDRPVYPDFYVRPVCLHPGCDCDYFEERETRSDLMAPCPECGYPTEEVIDDWWCCTKCGHPRGEV